MTRPLNGNQLAEALQKQGAALAQGFVDLTRDGAIKATCQNTRNAILRLGIRSKYNAFHNRFELGGQAIAAFAGELSDNACVYARKLIETEFGFDPGREKMLDAAEQLCLENQYDPIVDYLDNLMWDETPRIDTWLTQYAGVPDSELTRAISRIVLIAQVRRARHPGCKFDQIPVLEGPEGTLKSTLLQELAGGPAFFSDQTILGCDDKEVQEKLNGVWIFEIAELANVKRAEVEHVKAFASRTEDRARPAYGRALISRPRRCILWGSTNNDEYLRSQTGNRRFWPLATGHIDLEAFKRDRDQLLAEAAQAEADGESIVLPRELWAAAAEEQEQRREIDPWEDVLANVTGDGFENGERVLTDELLGVNLGIPADRRTPMHTHRLANVMRRLGWQGPKTMRIGNKRGKGFWR